MANLLTDCARSFPAAWTSYGSEPRATFRWKKCRDSKMKFDKLDKSARKVKVAQGSTHISQTNDTNKARVNPFKGDQGMNIIHR